jgi:alpha-glucosidase
MKRQSNTQHGNGHSLTTLAALVAMTVATAGTAFAADDVVAVVSPDGSNRAELTVGPQGPQLKVVRKGETIIAPSALGLMVLDGPRTRPLAPGGYTLGKHQESDGVDDYVQPVGKTSHVVARYRQSEVTLAAQGKEGGGITLVVRAYDDGVAFRYVLPARAEGGKLAIQGEATEFRFAGDYACRGLNQGRFVNSFEGEHDAVKASQLRQFNLFQAPFVCKTPKNAFAIAESDPQYYPGAWYAGLGDGGYGVQVVLSPRPDNDPDLRSSLAAAIVDLAQPVRTPWRVLMLGDSVGKLTESNLINALATPSKIADTSWIKPGLTAWDWWNGTQWALPAPYNANGQQAGMNTATYLAYADFAADMGLSNILIDEGWSVNSMTEPNPKADVTRPKPSMDMAEIIRHAGDKGVGVWIWLQWKQLDRQMDDALATYERWGIKGIKVDFINRNDQEIMPFYTRLLAKAAEHHLMVDLHGAFPPAGLMRTWPNYVTQEGVLGAENNKWSARITAKHNIALAFTRGLLGPMDYTPGGFRHVTPREFPQKQRFIDPVVMTTRGAALAMYVVYDSPLQMVADSPLAYRKPDGGWADGVDFIRGVPTSWDETRFVSGDFDDHVVLARRKGAVWYVGGMTDKAQKVTIPTGFLGAGRYTARTWEDGATISTLRHASRQVGKGDRLTLTMAANGGGVMVLEPVK